MRAPALASALVLALSLTACVVYEAPSVPPSFDRSWNAAMGAMRDAGVDVSSVDRASGTIVGTKQGSTVTIQIRRQADGDVRVDFNARGGPNDPAVANAITSAYQVNMGRY